MEKSKKFLGSIAGLVAFFAGLATIHLWWQRTVETKEPPETTVQPVNVDNENTPEKLKLTRAIIPEPEPTYDDLFPPYDAKALTGFWKPEKRLGYGQVRVENGEGYLVGGTREKVLEFRQDDDVIIGRIKWDNSRWTNVHLHPIPDQQMLTFLPVDENVGSTMHWFFENGLQ